MGYALGRILLIALLLATAYCAVMFVVQAPSWVLYGVATSILFAIWNELA
jgi:hypothetical protein